MVSATSAGREPRFLINPRHYLHQQQQKESPMGLGVTGLIVSMSTADPAEALSDDPSKKIRKPYTITKSRESWTEQEHDKFLEALQLFDRDWKKIEAFVGSKSVIQIRSHAQKYFLKVQKNGTHEHVPPPRPKRKATHPYPQKASKNAHIVSQPTIPFQTSSCLIEPGYTVRSDSSLVLRNSSSSGTRDTWTHGSTQPVISSLMIKDIGSAGAMMVNTCCRSSTESPSKTWNNFESADQGHDSPSLRALPDFAQVYSFIGAVFDPSTSGHLQKLKKMDPIDVETALLLMRNLSLNLASSDFEDHKKLLSSHDLLDGEVKPASPNNMLETSEIVEVPFIA